MVCERCGKKFATIIQNFEGGKPMCKKCRRVPNSNATNYQIPFVGILNELECSVCNETFLFLLSVILLI